MGRIRDSGWRPQNRRTRGLYQPALPSRFVDELPPEHVEVVEAPSRFGGAYAGYDRSANPYGRSRFDEAATGFQASYQTPGWQRAQQRWKQGHQPKRGPQMIEGELVASSAGQASDFQTGERIFHQKFGYGQVVEVDGNKLTVDFDKAGRKRVVDSFVDRVGANSE